MTNLQNHLWLYVSLRGIIVEKARFKAGSWRMGSIQRSHDREEAGRDIPEEGANMSNKNF